MNKKYNLLVLISFLFYAAGCSIIDGNARPDTKKHVIHNIEDKLTSSTEDVSYVEETITEPMVEDLSSYVTVDEKDDIQEITNVQGLNTGKIVFLILIETGCLLF